MEKFTSLVTYGIGPSGDGDYHMNMIKALCYKALGDKKKAIEIINKLLSTQNYNVLPFDYLHLGVLELEMENYPEAINAFKKEIEINDNLADTHYYLALAYKKSGNKVGYEKNILMAKEFYSDGKRRTDPYIEPMDKVYLVDIDTGIKKGW